MELPVYGKEGEKKDSVLLDEKKFDGFVRKQLLKDAVIMYEANKRQGTASTKTRGEVAGSGKKPWKQKHTGRARVGSVRSPLWRGGGISFGPKPRDYSYTMPKKARRLALLSALNAKIRDGELVVVDDLKFEVPKTKQMLHVMKALGLDRGSCLVVDSGVDEILLKSARNIPYVRIMESADLNAYEVLRPKKILITKSAMSAMC